MMDLFIYETNRGRTAGGRQRIDGNLARWRGSRFATLNAGGNVLVKLTSSSFYLLPESWPSTGYPGPLEYVFNAVNS